MIIALIISISVLLVLILIVNTKGFEIVGIVESIGKKLGLIKITHNPQHSVFVDKDKIHFNKFSYQLAKPVPAPTTSVRKQFKNRVLFNEKMQKWEDTPSVFFSKSTTRPKSFSRTENIDNNAFGIYGREKSVSTDIYKSPFSNKNVF